MLGPDAGALYHLGWAQSATGQPWQALSGYEQALRLYREAGVRGNEAATLTGIGQQIQSATGALERVNEILDAVPTVADAPGARSLAVLQNEITLDGVGFSYTIPTDDDLRDEFATEVYYRLQVTEGFELSGSAQLIIDPSASDDEAAAVFGLRARFLY